MTKYRGRSNRPLPDMGIAPDADPEYTPPSCPPAEELEYPIDLEDLLLVVRQVVYRNFVVDFALMLYALDTDTDTKHEICRVDCCHGAVHRHDFRRNKDAERDAPTELWPIDARKESDPWRQVDEQFNIQYDKILTDRHELRRRWAA